MVSKKKQLDDLRTEYVLLTLRIEKLESLSRYTKSALDDLKSDLRSLAKKIAGATKNEPSPTTDNPSDGAEGDSHKEGC